MGKKKIKKVEPKKKNRNKIDIDQTLLQGRRIFLFDSVNSNSANYIIKQLITLDKISSDPIVMYINSPGGTIGSGFAIIDAMLAITAPVITIIIGQACSMAGLISVAGKKRVMTAHSVWMAHDAHGMSWDYVTKMIDRVEFLKEEQKRVFDFLSQRTKLSKAELDKAIKGELWLYPKACSEKGIVDVIMEG